MPSGMPPRSTMLDVEYTLSMMFSQTSVEIVGTAAKSGLE